MKRCRFGRLESSNGTRVAAESIRVGNARALCCPPRGNRRQRFMSPAGILSASCRKRVGTDRCAEGSHCVDSPHESFPHDTTCSRNVGNTTALRLWHDHRRSRTIRSGDRRNHRCSRWRSWRAGRGNCGRRRRRADHQRSGQSRQADLGLEPALGRRALFGVPSSGCRAQYSRPSNVVTNGRVAREPPVASALLIRRDSSNAAFRHQLAQFSSGAVAPA